MQPKQNRWWESTWAKLGVVLVVIGGVVDVAGFVDLVKPLAELVDDGARWLYPFWLTIGLGLLLVLAAVVLAVGRHRLRSARTDYRSAESRAREAEARADQVVLRARPERVAHDTRILRVLRETLPRSDISYWGDVDFGGTWDGTKTRHLMELHYERDAVEDQFLDPDLERLRCNLMSAARRLMKSTANWGGPSKAGPRLYDLGQLDDVGAFDEQHQEAFQERWEQRREKLGELADQLVEAYDALMAEAHHQLPAAFDDFPAPNSP